MGHVPQEKWEQHYIDGLKFRPLGEAERRLLAEYAPAPAGGGLALEVCCGTGELAAHLVAAGYTVDAVDLAAAAWERARTEHNAVAGVRWLRLDIEHGDPAELNATGYDLITLRLMYPFLPHRTGPHHRAPTLAVLDAVRTGVPVHIVR